MKADLKLVLGIALVLVVLDSVAYAKRAKKAPKDEFAAMDGAKNMCENKHEFNRCKDRCYQDRDCNDEANLNCSVKCKQACERLEKIGRCRGSLLESILDNRGRLEGHGGRSGSGKRGGRRSGRSGRSGRKRAGDRSRSGGDGSSRDRGGDGSSRDRDDDDGGGGFLPL